MIRGLLITLLLNCCLSTFYAQTAITDEQKVAVLVRQLEGKVRIRWAPTTPSAWLKANTYGYIVKRFTLSRDGVRLSAPEEKLMEAIVKPAPLVSWEKIATENDYAAILAQALYGEGFMVGNTNGDDDVLLKIINQSREAEQRFAFGLFAADMNFEAAVKAGLGFEDATVVKGEEYLYRIETKVPKEILDIKRGSAILKMEDKIGKLPAPVDLFVKGEDKTILISWDNQLFRDLYVGYFVERSDDGITFKRLNKSPLVNMNDKLDKPANRMLFTDTITQNNKKYHYRVIGVTSFGENSPPSKVSVQSGIKKLEAFPRIKNARLTANGNAQIEWEFSKEAEKQITSFQLNRADKDRGSYELLIKDIAVFKRKLIVKNLNPSNYFTISAIGNNNQKTTSNSAFVQTIDSIPPIPPSGLEATIETTGVVKLKWKPNLEKDMLGYRVFRAHIEMEEYVQLTISPIPEQEFVDTIKLKSLNSKVFYKVVAVDERFNMSDFSEPLMLKKPDIVPPTSPVFSSYKVTDGKVLLQWIASSSNDVESHKLYRKTLSDQTAAWQEIYKTTKNTAYEDSDVSAQKKYRYAIFAEDQSGLISQPSSPITVTAKGSATTPQLIKRTSGVANREKGEIALGWTLAETVKHLTIYKAKNDDSPSLYREFSFRKESFLDQNINPGNTYSYTLKAIDNFGYIVYEKIKVTY